MALPEDGDAEGCEETVKEGLPENYEAEIRYAVVDTPEVVDTSWDDVMLPPNALPSVCRVDGDLLADKFCNISMTKMNKLFLAATWFMPDAEREELQGLCEYSSYQFSSEITTSAGIVKMRRTLKRERTHLDPECEQEIMDTVFALNSPAKRMCPTLGSPPARSQ